MRIGVRSAVAAAIACASVGAVAWGLSVPVEIKRVDIRGARTVPEGEIRRVINLGSGRAVTYRDALRMEAAVERHAAFTNANVSRGLTGTLHVRLVEREPVAWMKAFRCAVAEDGTLLPHVRQRDSVWICLEGLEVSGGRVIDADAVREALDGHRLSGEADDSAGGVWRRLRSPAPAWEWTTGGRCIQMTSPISEDELKRLARFRRAYPEAWNRARLLDLRFADRVVVKR